MYASSSIEIAHAGSRPSTMSPLNATVTPRRVRGSSITRRVARPRCFERFDALDGFDRGAVAGAAGRPIGVVCPGAGWAVAERIAANDPAAVQLTKKAINLNIEATGFREALRKALEIDVLIESMEEQ